VSAHRKREEAVGIDRVPNGEDGICQAGDFVGIGCRASLLLKREAIRRINSELVDFV
jgi:hypothetical protein